MTSKQKSQNFKLRTALKLIKLHITEEANDQNRHLHNAVQLIVDVAREHNLLIEEVRRAG